jgi:hypothetical protein
MGVLLSSQMGLFLISVNIFYAKMANLIKIPRQTKLDAINIFEKHVDIQKNSERH